MGNRLASVEQAMRFSRGMLSAPTSASGATALGKVFAFAKAGKARAEKPWPRVHHPDQSTAWAGPLTVMINWRNRQNSSVTEVIQELDGPAQSAFQAGRPVNRDEWDDLLEGAGLVIRPLKPGQKKIMEEMLLRYGPLWLRKADAPGAAVGHVVVGLESGDQTGTKVEVIDPASGRGRRLALGHLIKGAKNLSIAHWPQDARLAGNKKAMAARTWATSSSAHLPRALNQSFDIRYDVQLIPQLTAMSCWAAGCAMIVGWRDQISLSPQEIANAARYFKQYKEGLQAEDTKILKIWGFVTEPLQTFTIQGFKELLEDYGPLWVASVTPGPHIRVVTGMYGDGSPGNTFLRINDPWDRAMKVYQKGNKGSQYEEKYTEFLKKQTALADQEMALKAPIYIAHLPELPAWLKKMRLQGLSAYLPASPQHGPAAAGEAMARLDGQYGNLSLTTSFDPTAPTSPANPLVNCLKRNHYTNELQITGTVALGSKGEDVRKVQEWLNLWRFASPKWSMHVGIDGDFDTETDNALRAFQKMAGQKEDGIVDAMMFEVLTNPLRWAFTRISHSTDLRQLIVAYAAEHVQSVAVELSYGSAGNRGPWVRSYMLGQDGEKYYWCMGFAQTILDLAFSTVGRKYTDLMPVSGSCDAVGKRGLADGVLIRNSELAGRIAEVKPGDLFLCMKNPPDDWNHTGIITGVKGHLLFTIEGNTNDEGSNNGYEVCARSRDFTKQNIDIFRLTI